MYIEPRVKSSYREYKLGEILYAVVRDLKPKVIVEFGLLEGYSTIAMGRALKANGFGKIKAYDLFEKYPYKHAVKKKLMSTLGLYGVRDIVDVENKDFFDWIRRPEPCDLVHIDISNNGDIIRLACEELSCAILFEGGTEERDNIEWMKKYNKTPIFPMKDELGYDILSSHFPGLSMRMKKGGGDEGKRIRQ